jgi:hypothetical protein
MKLKLDDLESGQEDMKSETKDLSNGMDKDIKDLGNKTDREFEI